MLELKNIIKTYDGKKIIQDINLTIKKNEFTILLGPSGCGKSTLLKIISGIVSADTGEVWLDKKNISNEAINKRDIVIMFQEHNLFPHMNVFDNVGFALKMKKEKPELIKTRVNELLKMVKLEDQARKFPAQLSGGQKQRVAIIRALAVLPKLLLLDEPFSNLDISLRAEMQELIKEVQKQTRVTMLMVTHDKNEAFLLADKLAIMFDKKIVQFDFPEKIYKTPASMDVANFFGNSNYLHGKIKDNFFSSDVFNFKLDKCNGENKIEGECILLLRPENIFPDKNGVEFKITNKEFFGDRTLWELSKNNFKLKSYNLLSDSKINETVKISFKNDNVVFFNCKGEGV